MNRNATTLPEEARGPSASEALEREGAGDLFETTMRDFAGAMARIARAVTHNTAMSHITRNRRIRLYELKTLEDIDEPIDPQSAERSLDAQQQLGILLQFAARLKPVDRQVLLLYLDDLDANSISEITGLSSGNVAVKIHRVKQVLTRMHQGAFP